MRHKQICPKHLRRHKPIKVMSDDKKDPVPNEQRPETKKPKAPAAPKRSTVNPFLKNNKFVSPKSGNPGMKGGGHKGGGMKKGK